MAQITYTNKETLNSQPSIADKNKVTSSDMNEIKSVVNTNYGEVGDITNLNTTDKTSVVNAINELKGGEVYSTNEVNTGKLWINNKPIYRKVVVLTSPNSTGQWTDYTHNIADIDEFISCSANINLPTVGHQYFADFYQDSGYYFNFVPKLTMFSARVGYYQYTNKPMTIIVEYTKTTD